MVQAILQKYCPEVNSPGDVWGMAIIVQGIFAADVTITAQNNDGHPQLEGRPSLVKGLVAADHSVVST